MVISVLIPCWHVEATIAGALDSVEAQRGLPAAVGLELVLVVDGRPQDEQAIRAWISARGRARRWPLTLVCLERNQGAGRARQIGYGHCRGEFLALLDDDDLWHPRKLALQWCWHQRHPQQIMSGHGYGAAPTRREGSGRPGAGQAAVGRVTLRQLLVGGRQPALPTLMIRRALWRHAPEGRRHGEDWLMLAMVARQQPIAVLPQRLAWRSPAAPPLLQDPHSLTRQRLRLRWAQLRGYGVLVGRGVLPPLWLGPLLLWSLALALRRLLLDGLWWLGGRGINETATRR